MCEGKCNQSIEIQEKQENKEKQERPIAAEIIKEKNLTIKLLIVALLIQSAMLAGVAWRAIDFIDGYTFESVELNAETGAAVYQKTGEGDNIVNGQSESKDGDTEKR